MSRAYPYAGRRAAEDACSVSSNATSPSPPPSPSSSGRLPSFFSARWAATRPHAKHKPSSPSPPPSRTDTLGLEEGGLGEGVRVLDPSSLEILKRLGTGKFSEVDIYTNTMYKERDRYIHYTHIHHSIGWHWTDTAHHSIAKGLIDSPPPCGCLCLCCA